MSRDRGWWVRLQAPLTGRMHNHNGLMAVMKYKSRILRVISDGRIVAKMRSLPPHRSQAKTSAAKTQGTQCTGSGFTFELLDKP